MSSTKTTVQKSAYDTAKTAIETVLRARSVGMDTLIARVLAAEPTVTRSSISMVLANMKRAGRVTEGGTKRVFLNLVETTPFTSDIAERVFQKVAAERKVSENVLRDMVSAEVGAGPNSRAVWGVLMGVMRRPEVTRVDQKGEKVFRYTA